MNQVSDVRPGSRLVWKTLVTCLLSMISFFPKPSFKRGNMTLGTTPHSELETIRALFIVVTTDSGAQMSSQRHWIALENPRRALCQRLPWAVFETDLIKFLLWYFSLRSPELFVWVEISSLSLTWVWLEDEGSLEVSRASNSGCRESSWKVY